MSFTNNNSLIRPHGKRTLACGSSFVITPETSRAPQPVFQHSSPLAGLRASPSTTVSSVPLKAGSALRLPIGSCREMAREPPSRNHSCQRFRLAFVAPGDSRGAARTPPSKRQSRLGLETQVHLCRIDQMPFPHRCQHLAPKRQSRLEGCTPSNMRARQQLYRGAAGHLTT